MNEKEKKSYIKRIVADIGKSGRKLFVLSLIIIAIAKIALAIAPRISGNITESLASFAQNGSLDTNRLINSCIIVAILFLIGYGADGFINKNMVSISQMLVFKLRDDVSKKLNRMPISFVDTHPTGDILSRITNDMLTLSNSIESTMPMLVGNMFLLVCLVCIMFATNWKLTLIYLIILPSGMALTAFIAKKTNGLFLKQNEAMGDLSAKLSDSYSNHLLIKAFGCENSKLQSLGDANRKNYKAYVKSRFISGFVIPLSAFINNFAFIFLCIIGGIFLIKGSLTIGEFQAFIFYGNMIGTPLTSLASSMNNIQNGISCIRRIYEFLDEKEEAKEQDKQELYADNIKGEVVFEHVAFGYIPGKKLMEDVSFKAKSGQIMAIVGPSGAGKTTLINLLMRFYEIWDGKILVDGIDTQTVTKSSLRNCFGMVLQDSWIFDGTIAQNIAYGKPQATREEIIRAAKAASCDTFIDKLPMGYDTHICDENELLSAGEKQLISIARTLISDPDILILDEATSQVDTKTEELITSAMGKLMENRTTFIIAHRLYTIRNADQIIYMEDGDIKEVGSHKELIKKGGRYAKMYQRGVAAE